MNVVEYIRDFTGDVRYRVRFAVEKGKVGEFVVQLELQIAEQWNPVVRYDTAHGFAHRDQYNANGIVGHHELLPVSDYNSALTFAIEDVRTNWEAWVRGFRGEQP
jgi:hypothetical protein